MGIFDRAQLLIGECGMQALQSKKVIIFGVGGVGDYRLLCKIIDKELVIVVVEVGHRRRILLNSIWDA